MIAAIDPRMPCSAKTRLKDICEVIELPPFGALDSRVASHPDMLIFELGGKLFLSRDYYKVAKSEIDSIIASIGLSPVLTDDKFTSNYPGDIKFNAFTVSDFLIGNTEYISRDLKDFASDCGIKQVKVRQGYAKCSTLVLKDAVISADKGICDAVRAVGCDALQISPGDVLLDGYDCGFLGGASGVYKNKIFFCGDITKHKDFESISEFSAARGYDIISLSGEPLYDVGTILFFE